MEEDELKGRRVGVECGDEVLPGSTYHHSGTIVESSNINPGQQRAQ